MRTKTKAQLLKEIEILENANDCLVDLNTQLSDKISRQKRIYDQQIFELQETIAGLHKKEFINKKNMIEIKKLYQDQGWDITYGAVRVFIDNVEISVNIDIFNYATNCYETITARRYSYNIKEMLEEIKNKKYINEQHKKDILKAMKQNGIGWKR